MVSGDGVFLLGQETRRVGLEWGGRVCSHFFFSFEKNAESGSPTVETSERDGLPSRRSPQREGAV